MPPKITCDVCGKELADGDRWRIAGISHGDWRNLIAHRDCWSQRADIAQRLPDAIIVQDADDAGRHTFDRHWSDNPAYWAAEA
jgi:hypothetical protein